MTAARGIFPRTCILNLTTTLRRVMASFYTLLAMCGLMFAVSLGMGILPLSVSFSSA